MSIFKEATPMVQRHGIHDIRTWRVVFRDHKLRIVEVKPVDDIGDEWPLKAIYLNTASDQVELWRHRDQKGLWWIHEIDLYEEPELVIVQDLSGGEGRRRYGKIICLSDLKDFPLPQSDGGGSIDLVIGGQPLNRSQLCRDEIVRALIRQERDAWEKRREATEAARRRDQKTKSEKTAERERRRQRRELLRQEVLRRRTVIFWREADGEYYLGYPVREDEWQVLPDGTKAVLTGEHGEPLEAFVAKSSYSKGKFKSRFHFQVVFDDPRPRLAEEERSGRRLRLSSLGHFVNTDGKITLLPILEGERQISTVTEGRLKLPEGFPFAVKNGSGKWTLREFSGEDGLREVGALRKATGEEKQAYKKGARMADF